MNRETLQKIVNDSDKFKKYLVNLLTITTSDDDFDQHEGEPTVEFGYNDGYYWDTTTVQLNDDKETLMISFDAGSGSGWIPIDIVDYNVSVEQFRQYLLNRKWKDPEIDTLDLLSDEINKIEGSKVIHEEHSDF